MKNLLPIAIFLVFYVSSVQADINLVKVDKSERKMYLLDHGYIVKVFEKPGQREIYFAPLIHTIHGVHPYKNLPWFLPYGPALGGSNSFQTNLFGQPETVPIYSMQIGLVHLCTRGFSTSVYVI